MLSYLHKVFRLKSFLREKRKREERVKREGRREKSRAGDRIADDDKSWGETLDRPRHCMPALPRAAKTASI